MESPSGEAGLPSIEITLDLDAHGIISVRAKEIGIAGKGRSPLQASSEATKD